jgi:LysR family transcriptional regulator, regulator for metE and metH
METMQDSHGRLEVRHLRLVRAIADEGSVTRAAGLLHLSQSAVSHQLVDLERDMGARLFDRVGKRMVPTSAGARLIAAARKLLGELAEIERDITERREATVPLRITTSCFTSYHWLPAALAHFGDNHKGVELDIVLEATRRAIPALVADEVDLAIVTNPPRDDTWAKVELVSSELVALASPTHPIASRTRRGALRWGALHDCDILVYDISDHDLARLDDAIRELYRADTGRRLVTPIAVRKIPLTQALVELARAGRGVGVVDRWTVAPQLGKDLVALPMQPRASRTFTAVWRRANPRGLPMDELVKVIRAAGVRATRR